MLTEEEQARLRDAVTEVEAFVLALKRKLPGTDGFPAIIAEGIVRIVH